MSEPKKWVFIVLGILQVFIGIGGAPVGMMLIIRPTSFFPMEWLEGSIFPDYLVPGIFLFAVNGVGNLAGAYLTFRRRRLAGLAAMGLGLFLMAWIVVQVITMGLPIHWLQPLYFVLGVVELALGWRLRRSV
jgi:hypothetical protein